MRIAIVNSHYYPDEHGGAERSLRFLAEAAVARGHVCTVFTTGEARESTEINGVGVERFALHRRPAASAAGHAKLMWHLRDTYSSAGAVKMANAIRAFAPDVAHTNNLSGISVALWGCLERMGIPIAHTLRDYYLLCPNTAQFRNGQSCANRCAPCRVMGVPRLMATRHVKTVIGNSRFVLDSHLRLGAFAGARCEVIYNGYEPPRPVSAREAIPADRPLTIGFIGRLAPTKGVDRLIDAFGRVAGELSRPMGLRIAGTGDTEYVGHLRDRSCGLRVDFPGKMAPAAFYESVDVTVVPSLWHEPLARVIFESFAHGVPVIASARGGSPELVIPGRTGWLFDPDEPNALERAIAGAARELEGSAGAALSAACLAESQRFLPGRVVDSHLSAFERMLA
ncbi:MAG TPA: glycosyltransferase family 4 protein [Steroidobacteraceae bacterium]|nr:glycosyltransferase family 4 protein [Steroidobacteraceae bacterium]